jgi:hypothetical protein
MRIRLSLVIAAAGAAAGACAGLTMRGAESVKPGREPPGQKLAVYRPTDCQAPGGGAATRNSSLFLVQDAAGRRVLVELTPGYDSLVVKNTFLDRGEIAFQAVLKSKTGRMMLHDFRIPNDLSLPGRMAIASTWREVSIPGGGFHGHFDQPVLTCRLTAAAPDGTPLPPPTATADGSMPVPTVAPPVVPGDVGGTPEPRDRYAVGDTVAVDVQGQAVRAKVVQALSDDRYYVEYQTTPPTSEWVDKARIRGRLMSP